MSETSHELTKEKIDDAISLCKSYAKTRRDQMQRGLNDFNVFTCLLEKHDEVKLHSRFIHSLLDINGAHGQGDLFLRLFLQKCGLDDVGMNTNNCRVYKEYNNIDLYMTDGSRHIIIENKIYAGPQDRQIERYIETIKEENPDDDDLSGNLVVVYLSLDRDRPDEKSLGNYQIVKDSQGNCQIVNGAKRYRFLSIHYDHNNQEILDWIRSCKTQVSNITNLSIGLTQYEEVILSLYGRKEDKLMNLKKYIEENYKGNELDVLRDLREISTQFISLRESLIEEVFRKSGELLILEEIPEGWEVVVLETYSPKRYWVPLEIKQSKLKEPHPALAFFLQFEKKDGHDPIYGVAKTHPDVELNWFSGNESLMKVREKIGQKELSRKSNWWPAYDYYCRDNIFDCVVDYGVDKTAEDIVKKLSTVFENYREFVEECNEKRRLRPEQS